MALRYRWGPVRLPLVAQAASEGSNLIGRVPILNQKVTVTFKWTVTFFFTMAVQLLNSAFKVSIEDVLLHRR
jgi:hypothetical protein